MSRLDTLSPRAVASFFAPESKDGLVALLTLTGGGLTEPLHVTPCAEQRLSETADQVTYGLTSNGIDYVYVSMTEQLPDDTEEGAPSARIVINDVTKEVLPILRNATGRITVDMSLVLIETPDVIEVEFPELQFSRFSYAGDEITCELGIPGDESEPCPAHTYNPADFPGMF